MKPYSTRTYCSEMVVPFFIYHKSVYIKLSRTKFVRLTILMISDLEITKLITVILHYMYIYVVNITEIFHVHDVTNVWFALPSILQPCFLPLKVEKTACVEYGCTLVWHYVINFSKHQLNIAIMLIGSLLFNLLVLYIRCNKLTLFSWMSNTCVFEVLLGKTVHAQHYTRMLEQFISG